METLYKENKKIYICLLLIIIAGILRFSYGFFFQKESVHSDEVWSFGLANSYYEPYIQYSDDTSEYKNINQWINGDVFTKYLTVQKGERFAVGSVYYNLSCDTHPPLYFIILNFLCSFFPNKYILALGFLINIIAYIILSIFIYKLLVLITNSKVVSLMGVVFSTFSLALLCMTMFIRMYLAVATFTLIFTYLNAKLFYIESYRNKKSSYIVIGIVTMLGALTDNFFLPYSFASAVIMCICWIIKKEYKVLCKYIISLVMGMGIAILIFPQTIMRIFGFDAVTNTVTTPNSRYMSVLFQFKYALSYILKEIFGFTKMNLLKTAWYAYAIVGVIVCAIVLPLLAFLFRNEEWFKRFVCKMRYSIPRKIKKGITNLNYVTISMICSVIVVCVSAAWITNLWGLKAFGDRYIFACIPAALVIFLTFWNKLFCIIFKRRTTVICILLAVVLTLATISSNKVGCHYFMKYDNTVKLEDISKDSNFVIVSCAKWILVQYSARLMGCREVYFTDYSDFDKNIKQISEHDLKGDTYIILDCSDWTETILSTNAVAGILTCTPTYVSTVFNNNQHENAHSLYSTLSKCEELSFVNNLEYVGCDGINGFYLRVYKVN